MSTPTNGPDAGTVKKAVEERYAAIARGEIKSCCDTSNAPDPELYTIATMAQGYDAAELAAIPEGANLGLGCGDPTAEADLAVGQTVLDLGSGAGVDCFLAARRVGPGGHVIGVDMTDAMLAKARENARRGGFTNVEFRKGEIENLPVDSGTVDRIISNCVINLAPDKARVFAEAYRVLKPGGAFTVSDIVSFGVVPADVRGDLEKWAGCTAGAMEKEKYLGVIRGAGFGEVAVLKEVIYDYQRGSDYGFASLTVRATK
ncbi:MAG: arsenite methyltransferase [Acidobacteria bacterium]|nr:arsenite methyltransferase [Acidobacteriota bacterium]